jgi:formylglycine-generating enzyme required for sulfatase activity
MVPIAGKTWFLAAGQREVGEDTEEYLWVKGFEPHGDATSATLAISNEADIDSEDGLYYLLTTAIGTPGELETFREVEVSEEMTSLVAKHREAATEARAKAEREAAEAKAKDDREAAEAKAKLAAEIGAGRVGATPGVPLAGKAFMPFAFCPSGAFTMGSPASEDGHDSDENQVRVTLSKSFWMAKTEVTQAQWHAVMGDNPSDFKGHDLPVENVSWNDAQAFIKKVNGSGVMPSGWEMALPTEAQWEYACRAGETGPYSGGSIEQVAWYDGNSASKTHDVGTKKANAWGLHDMHGNVWEWCEDWHSDTLAGGTDPSGAPSGVDRASRGSSYAADTSFDDGFILPGDEAPKNNAANCRAADRCGNSPDSRHHSLGFRPALVPFK